MVRQRGGLLLAKYEKSRGGGGARIRTDLLAVRGRRAG